MQPTVTMTASAAPGLLIVHALAQEALVSDLPVIGRDAVAASVRIEIANDGSAVAVGIPDSVPRGYGEVIAGIATDAALKHWQHTRPSRPTPSRDDRRLFTKCGEGRRAQARTQSSSLSPMAPGVPQPAGRRGHAVTSCPLWADRSRREGSRPRMAWVVSNCGSPTLLDADQSGHGPHRL